MFRKTIISIVTLLALALVISAPAAAQGVVWTTTIFNNGGLSGSPAITRQDGAVSFNWGAASPANGINADNFSIRFGADPYLSAGTYRFYAQADDKVRVIVDFNYTPLIDTWTHPAVAQLVTGDVTLAAGTHHVQVDYVEVTGNAYVYVSWANLATNPSGPNFSTQTNLPVTLGSWTAQYYGNNSLSGSPTAIFSETSPTHNWGTGSPVASIPVDNFSAQWSSVQTLNAGLYSLSVSADDGVRVFVDGVAVINEWHLATAQTYTVPLNLIAGSHTFIVQYYEAAGVAFLNFNLTLPGTSTPTTPTTSTGATITVATPRLNVRDAPDPVNGRILTVVSMGDVYALLGRNVDATWFQINSPVGPGWVSARFVTASPGANVPVVGSGGTQQPTNTGYTATATPYVVNIRAGAGTQYAVIAKLPAGASAVIVGRNSASQWWQINYNGITGWVSAVYAVIQPGANVSTIPVTG